MKIIDAWMQHPTPGFLGQPIFESVLRWTKQSATSEIPLAATIELVAREPFPGILGAHTLFVSAKIPGEGSPGYRLVREYVALIENRENRKPSEWGCKNNRDVRKLIFRGFSRLAPGK